MSEDNVLILGARSDIAMSVARRFAKEGYNIQLAARNVENLSADKSDIELRYDVTVSLHEFDVLNIEAHNGFVNSLIHLPSVAICAVGYMGKQSENEKDILEAARVMRSNYEGPVSILALLANQFEQRGSGTLVGISSVAGERGRATNYIYGSAKAGYTAFLSGLRNRLAQKGVHVITVLPGFVDTKMTEGMNLPASLTANPDEFANKIFEAIRSRKNIFYYKKIWFLIMIIIRNIPERLFKNMKI
jgi:short-subunit dehydrogenase